MLYVWQRRLASRPHASVCSMFPYRKYHQHHICYHQTKEAMSHIANITNTTKSGNASLRKFCCHQMVKAKFHIKKATNPIAISSKITAVFPRHASSNINASISTASIAEGYQLFEPQQVSPQKNDSSLNM